jgi:hypothetical protein
MCHLKLSAMKNLLIAISIVLLASYLQGQPLKMKGGNAGVISLGARSSIGIVNDGKWQQPAFGVGGQFRIRFTDRVNSDWFFDYLTSDIKDYAWRTDYHIGWSMLYYLRDNLQAFVQPYVVSGHCFENLKFIDNVNPQNKANRWSASVQSGIGVHLNLTDRFDLSCEAQYMLHFGTKITATAPEGTAIFTKHKGFGIQDHILIHMSINYKIADLW